MHKDTWHSYPAKFVFNNHEIISIESHLIFTFFLLSHWPFIMIDIYLDLNRFGLLKYKAFVAFSTILTRIPVHPATHTRTQLAAFNPFGD